MLTTQEMKLFAFLAKRGGQFEMKPWSEIKEETVVKMKELEKRGFIRFSDAFIMPFKTPTGTQFCILTDAGKIAYESQLPKPVPVIGLCNHAFLRPDGSCVHCGAPCPNPVEPYRTPPGWEKFDPNKETQMGDG